VSGAGIDSCVVGERRLFRLAPNSSQQCISQRIRPKEILDADFFEVPQRLREVLASLIAAASSDIILGNSTSYGLTDEKRVSN
jgi:kynureninase